MNREEQLSHTFVELADTLVTGFDVADLLHTLAARCVELADVDAAGIMLADHSGALHVVGSSSEQAHLLELLEIQQAEGPCVESYENREIVAADLTESGRWPALRDAAAHYGFRSIVAFPMRLRSDAIGAVNLFRSSGDPLTDGDLAICRALADIATIGLLQERAIREARLLAEQLQVALNTRVVIEQAKGVLSQRLRVDMDVAFARMRGYARSNNRLLAEVARDIVAGRVPPELLS